MKESKFSSSCCKAPRVKYWNKCKRCELSWSTFDVRGTRCPECSSEDVDESIFAAMQEVWGNLKQAWKRLSKE